MLEMMPQKSSPNRIGPDLAGLTRNFSGSGGTWKGGNGLLRL
jgi:hypothetical protein